MRSAALTTAQIGAQQNCRQPAGQQQLTLIMGFAAPTTIDPALAQGGMKQVARRSGHALRAPERHARQQAIQMIEAWRDEMREAQQCGHSTYRSGVARVQRQADHRRGDLAWIAQRWRGLQRAAGVIAAIAKTRAVDDRGIDVADVNARPLSELAA